MDRPPHVTLPDLSIDLPRADSSADLEEDQGKRWPQITNRCAAEHPLLKRRALHPVVEAPAEPKLEVAWQRVELCEGFEEPSYRNDGVLPDMFAIARHEQGEAVVSYLSARLNPLPGQGSRASTWLSVDDGAVFGCAPLGRASGVTSRPLLVLPGQTDRLLTVSETYQDDHSEEFPNPHGSNLYLHAAHWDDSLTAIATNNKDETNPPHVRLLPDGQLLVQYKGYTLLSVDAYSGEINWLLRPGDIGKLVPDIEDIAAFGFHLLQFDPQTREILFEVQPPAGVSPGRFLAIDSCGDVREIERQRYEDIRGAAMANNTRIMRERGGGLRWVDEQGKLRRQVKACGSILSLDDQHAACINYRGGEELIQIVDVQGNIAPISREELELPDEVRHIALRDQAVAVGERWLLLRMVYGHIDGGTALRLYLVDWKAGKLSKFVDLFPPEEDAARLHTQFYTPLVASDGTIILREWGYFIGIKTNLGGLAPSAFPRGYFLGRNQNLGHLFYRRPFEE